MRIALLAIASGFVLSTAALADEPQSAVQPQQIADRAPADGSKLVCHHIIHEGLLTPIVRCQTRQAWENTRIQTEELINDIQVRSYSRPAGR